MKMKSIIRHLFDALMGAAFIAFLSQVAFDVPWAETKIPISGQTFAVLVTAMILGKWTGTLAVLMYLLAGGLGLPVFADGGSGWNTFLTGSGGYLVGFAIAAFVAGWLGNEMDRKKSLLKCILIMLVGTLIIMGCGVLYIVYLNGGDMNAALANGFYPFVPGAAVKILLGAVTVWLVG